MGNAHPTARPAFTIIELILVLGLVVLVTAMAWPAFREMFRSARLRDGASELRTFLRQARRHAIADAIAYRCDFLPGTAQLRMVPASQPWTDELASHRPESTDKNKEFVARIETLELPDGVQLLTQEEFDAGPAEEDESKRLPADVVDFAETDLATWIPLAEFYPDGSVSTATVRLADDRNVVIELVLDSLTGQVTIGAESQWLTRVERREREEQAELTETQ